MTFTNEFYDIHRAPLCGGNQLGLFAKMNIVAGTRIHRELPLGRYVNTIPTPIQIAKGIYSLTRVQQNLFKQLNYAQDLRPREQEVEQCFGTQNHTVIDQVKSMTRLEMYSKSLRETNYLVKNDGTTIKKQGSILPRLDAERAAILVAKFNDNSFKVGKMSRGMSRGIFFQAARLNHSCVPNCYVSWNSLTGGICVHTIQDVQAGEEFLIMYDIEDTLFQDRETRMRHLKEKYGFDCNCPACMIPAESNEGSKDDTPNFEANSVEANRKAIAELFQQYDDPYSALIQPEKTLDEIYAEMLAYMDNEDLKVWEKSEKHIALAEIYSVQGHYDLAAVEAEKATDIARVCLGDDAEDTRRMRDLFFQFQSWAS